MPEYSFADVREIAKKQEQNPADFLYDQFKNHNYIPNDPLYEIFARQIISDCCDAEIPLKDIQSEVLEIMRKPRGKIDRMFEIYFRAECNNPNSRISKTINSIVAEKEDELYKKFEDRKKLENGVKSIEMVALEKELKNREASYLEREKVLQTKETNYDTRKKAIDFETQRLIERKEAFNKEKQEFVDGLSTEERARYDDMLRKKKEQNKII